VTTTFVEKTTPIRGSPTRVSQPAVGYRGDGGRALRVQRHSQQAATDAGIDPPEVVTALVANY